MATFTGQAGMIKIGSDIVGELRSFTIEQTQDTVETTSMVADGNSSTAVSRVYKPGLSTFTITGDIYFDADTDAAQIALEGGLDAAAVDAALSFKVYPAGGSSADGQAFSGDGVMTSFSVSSSVDGAVEASFAAQGTGPLTIGAANTI